MHHGRTQAVKSGRDVEITLTRLMMELTTQIRGDPRTTQTVKIGRHLHCVLFWLRFLKIMGYGLQ